MFRFSKISLLVLSLGGILVASTPAVSGIDYIKNASLKASMGNMSNPPAMVFVPKNGKYEAEKKGSYIIPIRLKAQKRLTARIYKWNLKEHYSNSLLADHGFNPVSLKKLDKQFQLKVGWNELKHLESKGRKACEQYGKADKKVVKPIVKDLRLYYTSFIFAKPKNDAATSRQVSAVVPVRLVCMPEEFKVTDAKLSVKYHGSSRKCPVKVTVSANFKTNKPGGKNIEFYYIRGDGSHMTVKTKTSGSKGTAFWKKDYTIGHSVNRKYMLTVINSPFHTGWVPVKISCKKKSDGFKNPMPKNNL
ncbi:hypothetical protein [Denitrobaculum tricleocarpae]|uniref:Uncharacterized protein n=1 Tax=Denitrobaculum tricleocarpae TaxID=2591009 RepID=A0A545U298_9PROT|nr:hypothetical protein [Denitrobaculum tricleocarpae]TQV83602.1 hypothetical protein FKG95_03150 [Denitrobaculum tricleocarpae]